MTDLTTPPAFRNSPPPGARAKRGPLDLSLALALIVAVLVLQIRWSPRFVEMGPDSGLFAYGGQRILQGDLLYRDVFDTKPPGVFYLDAAALWVGGETAWPLWALSALWSAATVIGLFGVLRSVTGRAASLAATLLFLVVLHQTGIFQGGNSTELFALIPQVLALAATVWRLRQGKGSAVFLLGLATALAFLFKPTYIALGLVSLALILGKDIWEQQRQQGRQDLFLFLAGFLLPPLLVGGYWFARGGLSDMVNDVFVYGSAYVRGGLSARSLYVTFRKLTESAPMAYLTMLATAGMVLVAWGLRAGHRGKRPLGESLQPSPETAECACADPARLILLVAFVATPVEWALVALSGQNFGHYFITPLPAMAVMAAFALDRAWSADPEGPGKNSWRFAFSGLASVLFTVGVVLGLVQAMPDQYQWNLLRSAPYGGEVRMSPLVRYIAERTSPGDGVLVWGNRPGVNFQAVRPAPSRYLFPTQILLRDGRTGARLAEFLAAIERNRPKLVAEEVVSEVGIPPLLAEAGEDCRPCSADALAAWARLREYMSAHYGSPENVGGWVVYERLDAGPAQ
jgi:hypothetical protein